MLSKINYKGETWKVELSDAYNTADEAGTSTQRVMKLVNKDGSELFIRAKKVANLHESMVYDDISSKNLALREFVPQYIGTLDASFESLIDPSKTDQTSDEVYWLLLEDVVLNLPNQSECPSQLEVCDFKFAAEPLCRNVDEREAHNYSNQHSVVYKFFQKIFFSLSHCPFVYQKSCKTSDFLEKILSFFIRLMTICETKDVMKDHFSKLEADQLQNLLSRIEKLVDAIENSGYAFCDSSLLFVPSVDGNGNISLNIHMIDLAHGFTEKEKIDGYQENVEELIKSIRYLQNKVEKAIKKKTSST